MKLLDPPNYWKFNTVMIWPPGSGNKAAKVWDHKLTELRVIASYSKDEDGSEWIHLSVSRSDRVPTWQELSKVKDEFLGPEVEAYQVLAKKSQHVNIAEALHLWVPLDGKRRVANLHSLVLERAP